MSHTVIGLVGGIASGKSTVAAVFSELLAGRTVDADAIARRVVARRAVAEEILSHIPGSLGEGGTLDREKLAKIVFSDQKSLKQLEAITHPPIRRAIMAALGQAGRSAVTYLDAPLLLENGLAELCDAVVYVACPAETRRRRATRNRGWTEAEHRKREARQWSCRKKRAHADFVVDNSGDLARARRDVRRVLRQLER